MEHEDANQIKFFSEMSEFQVTAREFFGKDLLAFLNRDFGLKDVLISYFDPQGNFLSWTTPAGAVLNSQTHPYGKFIASDIVRHVIYQDALRDRLTYFNVTPRLYKSTDIIDAIEYDRSAYVRFIEEHFRAHYSVTLAFGINAYIQVAFFKSREDGDFTDAEIKNLYKIYVYIATGYKTFKKHEQAKIVTKIQDKIIASGKKAYLVTDDFLHVMSFNKLALEHLQNILGIPVGEEITDADSCNWLPFLLAGAEKATPDVVHTRQIKEYLFEVHTYDQTYSNGIIDRYHWITISKEPETEHRGAEDVAASALLTQAEKRVAALLYRGLSYRAIADELVVSYHTVKKHVQNIYSKCGVNTRLELCRWLEKREE